MNDLCGWAGDGLEWTRADSGTVTVAEDLTDPCVSVKAIVVETTHHLLQGKWRPLPHTTTTLDWSESHSRPLNRPRHDRIVDIITKDITSYCSTY